MRCPRCGSDNLSVVDSRPDGGAIRRRRECGDCTSRFTTFERVELSLPMVIKKNGRREPFDRSKIQDGLLRACRKRPVSVEAIEATVERLERRLHELGEKEVSSLQIGDFLMEEIRELDKIAYVRFASVYREFSDVSQFMEALTGLDSRRRKKAKKHEEV